MSFLIVPIHARTASFRDPEFQNFHRTLRLPPPATCIGLAGAALGLMPAEAQAYFAAGEWELGVGGTSGGMANDLWKYDDFKTGSILMREILYDVRLVLAFGHADAGRLAALADAFRRPRFALSLGPSDSICHVDARGLRVVGEAGQGERLEHCYAAGDVVADTLRRGAADRSTSFSIRTTSLPLAQDLPARFDYGKGGVRMLRERRLLSYVEYPVHLTDPVRGVHLPSHATSPPPGPAFLPLFPL